MGFRLKLFLKKTFKKKEVRVYYVKNAFIYGESVKNSCDA